jgi:hypothetical protein
MVVTLKDFQSVVGRARLPARDREWFPRMLREFASATGQSGREPIVVERERVIGYLQTIKARGRAAWKRLHAVRAIEFYRDRVLRSSPETNSVRRPWHNLLRPRPTFGVCPVGTTSAGAVKPQNRINIIPKPR